MALVPHEHGADHEAESFVACVCVQYPDCRRRNGMVPLVFLLDHSRSPDPRAQPGKPEHQSWVWLPALEHFEFFESTNIAPLKRQKEKPGCNPK